MTTPPEELAAKWMGDHLGGEIGRGGQIKLRVPYVDALRSLSRAFQQYVNECVQPVVNDRDALDLDFRLAVEGRKELKEEVRTFLRRMETKLAVAATNLEDARKSAEENEVWKEKALTNLHTLRSVAALLGRLNVLVGD